MDGWKKERRTEEEEGKRGVEPKDERLLMPSRRFSSTTMEAAIVSPRVALSWETKERSCCLRGTSASGADFLCVVGGWVGGWMDDLLLLLLLLLTYLRGRVGGWFILLHTSEACR